MLCWQVEAPPPALKEDVKDDGGGLIDMDVDENGTAIAKTSQDMLADFSSPPVIDDTTKALQDVRLSSFITNTILV